LELVYLWVEDYKNIHRQGFNFSSRFNCHYDGEILTIKENVDEKGNKQYIENFFGDNINVTAIVGKNGSGKSSVLHSLIESNDTFFSEAPSVEKKFILCYIKAEQKTIATNLEFDYDGIFDLQKLSEKTVGCNNPYYLLHQDSSFNYFTRFWDDKTSMTTVGEFKPYLTVESDIYYKYISLVPNKDMLLSELDKEVSKNIILYIKNRTKNINDFFNPSSIFVHSFDDRFYEDCKNFEDFELHVVRKYLTNLLRELNIDEKRIREKFDEGIEIVGDFSISKILKTLESINTLEKVLELINSSISPINGNVYINQVEAIQRESFVYLVNKLKSYIETSKKVKNKNTIFEKNKNGIFHVKTSEINDDIIAFILDMYPTFNLVFFDNIKNIGYGDLSSGEKEYFKTILHIYHQLKHQGDDKSLLMLLDEPNNFLHPQWQKEFINMLIKLPMLKEYDIHFIITTHSPFLLSDIPKQNIIFLDTDIDGNCKVLKHNDVMAKKQTFGANIHTLLSDSFFMEDGLMGEFAKGKINEIIDYLNGKNNTKIKSDEEAQKLINIIGEPIVKNQLQRILDSKRLSKVDDIDELKDTMVQMQKRIDELEK